MALKSVVVDASFAELTRALRKFEVERGNLNLAAEWIDGLSPLTVEAELRGYPSRHMPESGTKLSLLKRRSTGDLLVRSITSELNIPEPGAAYSISGLDLEALSMNEAVCLLSRPAMHASMPEKVPA